MRARRHDQIREWWRRTRPKRAYAVYGALVLAALIMPFLLPGPPTAWKFLATLVAAAAAVGTNLLANVIQNWRDRSTPVTLGEARRRYLRELRSFCQVLPLAPLDESDEFDKTPPLDQVYIALDTTTPATRGRARQRQLPDLPLEASAVSTETERLSAQDAVVQTNWLVLLGDPGAGKSTFVRQLVANMATGQLAENTSPGSPADRLPILMTLRDLAPRLDDPALARMPMLNRRRDLARAVRDQAVADLARWEAVAFADGLRDALETGGCVLVLDGLDEVPPHLRQRVREAVRAVIGEYSIPQVIVTCRVRSYVDDAVLPAFQAHRLAPFNNDKITAFVRAWYTAQHTLGRVTSEQVEQKAGDLARAAVADELRELAENPMLLTTMAMMHQRNIGLPRERVRLYDQAVGLLLRRWERYRRGEAGLTLDPTLAVALEDERKVRLVMEALAYEAHRTQQSGRTREDLPRETALVLLDNPAYLGNFDLAQKFLDYVDERAGLLVGLGGEPGRPGSYRFPHRTFQEYLAACHLVCQRDPLRAFRAHTDEGDYWEQVVQLGAEELRYNRPRPYELLNLAYGLCQTDTPSSQREQRAVLWSGVLAAEAGREEIEQDTAGGADYLKRLRPSLVSVLRGALTTPERVEAGTLLARLGDPRFRSDAWYLPDEPLLGFVDVPTGPFLMGSDPNQDPEAREDEQPQHEVRLPQYFIGRYPVTVAQFRAFVDESGYEWAHRETSQGPPNYPVGYVSWHDTMEYCGWLTERLRNWDHTPLRLAQILRRQDGRIALPSEAEWEKAARGSDGRRYPWVDDVAPQQANYFDFSSLTTSAVGCFPSGKSPYGLEDMTGNVDEWTRSLWEEKGYPYPRTPAERKQREDLQVRDNRTRVVRGGSFSANASTRRCAFRYWSEAQRTADNIGFRVVLVALP